MKQESKSVTPNTPFDSTNAQGWRGHICVDGVATSGPEARAELIASKAGLKLASTLGEFRLNHTAVQCVRRAGFYPWFWGGLRIWHSVPNYPRRLQFCPIGVSSRQVLAELGALGFKTL